MKLDGIRYGLKFGEFHELKNELENNGYKVKNTGSHNYPKISVQLHGRVNARGHPAYFWYDADGDRGYDSAGRMPKTKETGRALFFCVNPNTKLARLMQPKKLLIESLFYKLNRDERDKLLELAKKQGLETQEEWGGFDFYNPSTLGTYEQVRRLKRNRFEILSPLRRKKGLFVRYLGHLCREGLMIIPETQLEKIVQELK